MNVLNFMVFHKDILQQDITKTNYFLLHNLDIKDRLSLAVRNFHMVLTILLTLETQLDTNLLQCRLLLNQTSTQPDTISIVSDPMSKLHMQMDQLLSLMGKP